MTEPADEALDLTVAVPVLADATARMARLLPTRAVHPGQAGLLLRAEDDAVMLTGADGEVGATMRVPALVRSPGAVLVSRSGFAATVAGLDAPELRLAVEGGRLALRTPAARFALPVLGDERPGPAPMPAPIGRVDGAALRAAAIPVAGAASRDHALPIFTGVRVRIESGRLSLLATDRYRMAAALLPVGAGDPDRGEGALVPAGVFAEMARQAGRAPEVTVHAGGELFGMSWEGGGVAAGGIVAATLGPPFPDAQLDRLLAIDPQCTAEVAADELAGAVERAGRYGGAQGRVGVVAADGVLALRASDPLAGESAETVKAAVRGDHAARDYQARFLLDALRPFAGRGVLLRIQSGLRATEVTAAPGEPDPSGLRYLIVPLRPATTGTGTG